MTRPRPAQPLKLHDVTVSGHAHRVRLFLTLLDLPFDIAPVDLGKGAHRTPDYLAMNAFGQVPVIQDGDVTLADSNAILVYLNERYASDPARWMPRDALDAARVQRWFSVSAGPLFMGPAAARIEHLYGRTASEAMVKASHALLAVMDAHLQREPFLVGDAATLADIANYSYVAHAPEGNVSLDAYPNVRAWVARIEALPGFLPMPHTAIGLRAAS